MRKIVSPFRAADCRMRESIVAWPAFFTTGEALTPTSPSFNQARRVALDRTISLSDEPTVDEARRLFSTLGLDLPLPATDRDVADSVLFLAGQLDTSMSGPDIDENKADEVHRRSIYFRHTPDSQVCRYMYTSETSISTEPRNVYRKNLSVA